jgi:hypothetical protein
MRAKALSRLALTTLMLRHLLLVLLLLALLLTCIFRIARLRVRLLCVSHIHSFMPVTPVAITAITSEQNAFRACYGCLSVSYSVRTPAGSHGSLWQHHNSSAGS